MYVTSLIGVVVVAVVVFVVVGCSIFVGSKEVADGDIDGGSGNDDDSVDNFCVGITD